MVILYVVANNFYLSHFESPDLSGVRNLKNLQIVKISRSNDLCRDVACNVPTYLLIKYCGFCDIKDFPPDFVGIKMTIFTKIT